LSLDKGFFSVLKKADIGVAMGNASDFVKSYANFATTSTYDNGIYNAGP